MDTADLKTPEMILIHEILVLFFRLASTKRQYKLISNEAICRTTEAQHSHNKSCNLHYFCASGNGFFKAANSVRGLRLEMDKCILRKQTQNFKLLLEAREGACLQIRIRACSSKYDEEYALLPSYFYQHNRYMPRL